MFLGIPFSDIFGILTILSLFTYITLDGFDLGIGILIPWLKASERDILIASVAPFWAANETWLVLAGGIILTAFPNAQGEIFSSLYLPTAVMLIGLLFRGVAFELRGKGSSKHKRLWDHAFFCGSLIASVSQGCMLGIFLFSGKFTYLALLTSILAVSAYGMIGSAWIFLKTTGDLQARSLQFEAYSMLLGSVALVVGIIVYQCVWDFSPYETICACVGGIALATAMYLLKTCLRNKKIPSWLPFVFIAISFATAIIALALHCYPWIIYGKMTLAEAAADEKSLRFMLAGALITLPLIVFYHITVHRVFKGKIRIPGDDDA